MKKSQQSHNSKSTLLNLLHIAGAALAILVIAYIYFVFSTTSLIAQHRAYDNQLDQLIADRSDLEYEYHTTSEQLFVASANRYNLDTPTSLSYISLSEGVNVAFARETE